MPTITAAQRRAATAITAKLAGLGFVLPGTIALRHVRCGKPGCRCAADPPVLHGPYPTWTRKVGGKTITRRLTHDQYTAYRPWIEAGRQAKALLDALEALSVQIIEPRATAAGPPSKAPGRPAAKNTSHLEAECGFHGRTQPIGH